MAVLFVDLNLDRYIAMKYSICSLVMSTRTYD